jgi:hypothetical protein
MNFRSFNTISEIQNQHYLTLTAFARRTRLFTQLSHYLNRHVGPVVQLGPLVIHRETKRTERCRLSSSSRRRTEESVGFTAPVGRGDAGGERRGRGDALVCAHPREVAAPPETPHGTLATSAGDKGRWRQAVAVLRCRATGCEARGRCNVS